MTNEIAVQITEILADLQAVQADINQLRGLILVIIGFLFFKLVFCHK